MKSIENPIGQTMLFLSTLAAATQAISFINLYTPYFYVTIVFFREQISIFFLENHTFNSLLIRPIQ